MTDSCVKKQKQTQDKSIRVLTLRQTMNRMFTLSGLDTHQLKERKHQGLGHHSEIAILSGFDQVKVF